RTLSARRILGLRRHGFDWLGVASSSCGCRTREAKLDVLVKGHLLRWRFSLHDKHAGQGLLRKTPRERWVPLLSSPDQGKHERYRQSALGRNGWCNCNLATQLNRIRR